MKDTPIDAIVDRGVVGRFDTSLSDLKDDGVNEYSFLRIYKDLANEAADKNELFTLYCDLQQRLRDLDDDGVTKWFQKSQPSKLDCALAVDAVAHAIHAGGETVLHKIYPDADHFVFKETLDILAGYERTNEVRKMNRGFFTTLLSDPSIMLLEKQQTGRSTKDALAGAIEEYKRLFNAGIASDAEVLTLHRYEPNEDIYRMAVVERGLDREENEPVVIGGPASVEQIDKEGHLITTNALREAFSRFMENPRTRNIQIFHADVQVGWPLPGYLTRSGQVFISGVDDKGLFLISELRKDLKVAQKVAEEIRKGNLKSYSIAGSALDTAVMQKGAQQYLQVNKLEMAEVTICIRKGTLVWTKSGLRPIEDIKRGDLVLTHTALWKPVLRTMRRPVNEQICRLRTVDGHSLMLTRNHPVRTLTFGKLDWVSASDIVAGDMVLSYYPGRKDCMITVEVASIENVPYTGDVFNLSVADDNSYVTEACVVHNCNKGMNQGAHFDILKEDMGGQSLESDDIPVINVDDSDENADWLKYARRKSRGGEENMAEIRKADKKGQKAMDAFREWLNETGPEARQKEHRRLLDEYGFPDEPDDKDADVKESNKEPWAVNEAGVEALKKKK